MSDETTGVPAPPDPDDSQVAIKRGRLKFISERDGGRPFDNCLICVALMGMRWMGYVIPPLYDDVVRNAANVADPNGTSFSDVLRGLNAKFGKAPTSVTHIADADLAAMTKAVGGRGRGKSVFAVIVNTGKLPPHYQRLVGQGYDGLHGLLIAEHTDMPVPSVTIFDPMGRTQPPKNADPTTWQPYNGELIAWSDLAPALIRDDQGLVKALQFVKNGARA
jgi:hypothetical protein